MLRLLSLLDTIRLEHLRVFALFPMWNSHIGCRDRPPNILGLCLVGQMRVIPLLHLGHPLASLTNG